jgi:hypothetical protein
MSDSFVFVEKEFFLDEFLSLMATVLGHQS